MSVGFVRPLASAIGALGMLALLSSAAAAVPRVGAPPPAATTAAVPAPPIRGVVQDTAGRPLANVQVVVAGVNRVALTDAEGRFVLRGLPAGSYHLDAILVGYARAEAEVIVPLDGEDVRVTIRMRPTVVRISGVVVTASPTGSDPLALTQSAAELSGRELARNLGSSLAATLSNEPGVQMRYDGPAATMPVIRGLTGERILVLQDGERAGDLSSASADHGVTVDPINAQRIEVVRGPGSLLYGSNAIGGVVNVISNDIPTTVPTRVEGYVGGQAESVNPGGVVSMGATAPLGGHWAATVRGSYRDIDDVRTGGGGSLANTNARNWNGLASLGYVGQDAAFGVGYRRYDFNYGIPAAEGDGEAGIRLDGARSDVLFKGSLNTASPLFPYVRVDGTAQWYEHQEIEHDGEVGTSFDLKTQTANLTAKTQWGPLTGAMGLQGLFKQYRAQGEEAFTPAANSNSGGVFVFQELPIGAARGDTAHDDHRATLQVGARYDVYRTASEADAELPDRFGPGRTVDVGAFSGSVGVNVPLGGAVSLGVNVARAFRAPTVEELFANGFHAAVGTFDVGNPDLSAEFSNGVDGTLRAEGRRGFAQLGGYYNRIDGYIAPRAVGTQDVEGELVPLVNYQQHDATLYGLEAQGELEVARNVVVGAMADLVRGDFRDGGPLPFLPPGHVGASVRYDNGRFSLGSSVRHGLEQSRVTDPDPAMEGAVDVPTDAYTLLNFDAGYRIITGSRAHTLALRLDNALDEEYRDATSRIKWFSPNPGRNVSLVYRVQF
jgi:iron complex outermembrane receptor protein